MYEAKYHNTELNNKTFLITGGAGFIGSNLVEYLLKHGAGKVRVLDNLSNGFYKNIEAFVDNPAFEFINGDIRDKETCVKALEGIEYVSHQAALGSVPRSINDPQTTNEVNISGFLNMLVAARDAKVKAFVYAASSSTYGDSKILPKVEDVIGQPLSPYAITKYVNELYANVFSSVYGFHTIGLRYFNVFGPRQDPKGAYAAVIPLFMDAITVDTPARINGDGGQTRDFTFVENAVQANIKGMLSQAGLAKAEVINIAYGQRISLNELWAELLETAGKKIEPIYGPDRPGDVRDSLADISKAGNLIGYKPEFSVFDGLKITYQWFIQNQEFIKKSK